MQDQALYQPIRDQPFAHLTNQRTGEGPDFAPGPVIEVSGLRVQTLHPPQPDVWSVWTNQRPVSWSRDQSGPIRGHPPQPDVWCLETEVTASTGTPGLAWQQRTMFVCGLVVVFSRLYGYEWWCLRQLSALIIIKSEILLRQINRLAVWKWGHEGLWDQWPGLWLVQSGLSVTHCTLWGPVHYRTPGKHYPHVL